MLGTCPPPTTTFASSPTPRRGRCRIASPVPARAVRWTSSKGSSTRAPRSTATLTACARTRKSETARVGDCRMGHERCSFGFRALRASVQRITYLCTTESCTPATVPHFPRACVCAYVHSTRLSVQNNLTSITLPVPIPPYPSLMFCSTKSHVSTEQYNTVVVVVT